MGLTQVPPGCSSCGHLLAALAFSGGKGKLLIVLVSTVRQPATELQKFFMGCVCVGGVISCVLRNENASTELSHSHPA